MFRASSFKLQMYAQCPQAYKFTYVDGLADQYKKPKPYLTMGAHVHNALKDFFELKPEKRDFPTLEAILRNRWRENRKGFSGKEDEAKWGTKAIQMLKLFCYKNNLAIQPVFLENYYDRMIDPGLKILGRIDRVDSDDEGLHIIDYKTGKLPETPPDPLQLALYGLIMHGRTEKPVTRASYLYLQNNTWQTIAIDESVMQDALTRVQNDVQTILADNAFPATINPHCKTCDFLEICPKQKEIQVLIDGEEL